MCSATASRGTGQFERCEIAQPVQFSSIHSGWKIQHAECRSAWDALRSADTFGPGGLPRRQLLRSNAGAPETVCLALFWSDLAAGRWVLVDHFCTQRRCYGVFRHATEAERLERAIPASLRPIFYRALGGESQKSIALDLGVSESSIALSLNSSKRRLGLCCRTSAIPLVIVLAVQAYRDPRRVRVARATYYEHDGQLLEVLSVQRPDAALERKLTPSETEVMRLIVEGLSCDEIAGLRHASRQTVVNQLSTARRKLRVSGRLELLHVLAAASA